MATVRCNKCGKTMDVSAQQKALITSGVKTVPHSCGGKFK